ncbi:aldehyde dehydrogenase (NADP(+)) [bacterium]|nr:MAG: aldehyde dehydrogenase (NADP(+)) [bacterium]
MTVNPTHVTGANLIAGEEHQAGATTFVAHNPTTGEPGKLRFHEASPAEVSRATAAAAAAFAITKTYSSARLAEILEAVAVEVEALGQLLLDTAREETGLGLERLEGERARTCGQFRAFAALLKEGSYVEAIIDTADAPGQPRHPDLRRMLFPIGPVAVFGSSNFPLAFSVPGGDTASALAAGCPVVVKAHPSHPATSELCAQAILKALRATDAAPGTFSMLQGNSVQVGQQLVQAPEIKAVGFTGSFGAGRALFDLAAARAEPIPVYAEMGSVNPLFVLPSALEARGGEIAEGLVASITMGAGQFCTKPGLVFVVDGEPGRAFAGRVAELAGRQATGPLLNQGIYDRLTRQLDHTLGLPGVEVLTGGPSTGGVGLVCPETVLTTTADVFLATPELVDEHFGPVAVIVRCRSVEQMVEVASRMQGNLTATLHATDADDDKAAALQSVLQEKVGRLIWNGYPTGVAVVAAMHHGGPYPASTFPQHTSVGATSIKRFQRPVAFQNLPDRALPQALNDANPLGILRLVNGSWTRDSVVRRGDS